MRRFLLGLGLVMGLGSGCTTAEVVVTPLPEGLDRQCSEGNVCPGDLLCVRLFEQTKLVDGGLVTVNNYTCHVKCQADADCPKDFVCFTTQVAPAQKVCVLSVVAKQLQPAAPRDGG